MNTMNSIKRHLNVQTAGHIVMLAFAVASLANVESFFAALHPALPLLSWGLGIALGSGLLVMAGLLSGMLWDWTDTRFLVVVSTAAALALLSGGIQAAAYNAHMASTIAAVIVGLSLPVVGELGVALAVSAYSQAQRRQRMTDAQTQLADGVRMQIGEAVATLDPTRIRGQVERAATQVTRAIVDATVNDMLKELARSNTKVLDDSDVKFTVVEGETPVHAPNVRSFGPQNLQLANAQRNAKANARRNALLRIIHDEFNGQPLDVLNKTELAQRLDTTRQTITRDLTALQNAGQISVNGVVSVLYQNGDNNG